MRQYTQNEIDRDVPEMDEILRERMRQEFEGMTLEELEAEFRNDWEDDW